MKHEHTNWRIMILLLLLFICIFTVIVIAFNKEKIIAKLGEKNKNYTCRNGICSTCTIDGNPCACGPTDCSCGTKKVNREVCEFG